MYFAPQIISAQQLPKINTDKVSSIVDPQVWVEIHGVAIDNGRNKTHRIDNNGKAFSKEKEKNHDFTLHSLVLVSSSCDIPVSKRAEKPVSIVQRGSLRWPVFTALVRPLQASTLDGTAR